ncbi:MAG TPA: MFS transporter [Pseudonocardiaceae bacterium]|nr:MFS transporter [Pseudonocardiaceae bacterium]
MTAATTSTSTRPVDDLDRHERSSPGFRRITLALFAAGLATFTALYCVQALLPALATSFHLDPASASLVVSVSTAALAIGVIPLTVLSEALGRTPVMATSLFTAAALGILAAFSPNFAILLVIRGLQGLALAGLQAVAMSYLAEELHRGSLGFGMGLYIAGNGIGGMIGRLLAGLIDDVSNWRWALGVIGGVALLCAVIFRLSILPSRHFAPRPLRFKPLAGAVARAFGDIGLLRLFVIGFLLMGCFVTVYNYLGFRLLGPGFNLPEVVVGLIFVVYLAGCFASAFAGRLVDRFGRPRLLWVMAVITIAGLVLMVPDNVVLVIVGLVVTTAGFFAAHSVASGWVGSRSARLGVQGSAVYLFSYYLGSSIGGTIGGIAFTGSGWSGLTLYTGSFIVAVLVLALTLRRLAPAASALAQQ